MGRYKSRAWSYEKYRHNRYVHSQKHERTWKGPGLHDAVEGFLFRRDTSLGGLVEKLLSNDFEHRRYSDR